MKAMSIAVAFAVIAVPLFASSADDQAAKSSTSEKEISAAATPVVDSPLVRAAKATGRLGKKPTNLITNDTLVKEGGHFTSTKTEVALPPVTNTPQRLQPLAPKPNAPTAQAKEQVKREKSAAHAASDLYGDSVEEMNVDPAAQEHAMQQLGAGQPAPSTSTQAPQETKKPPL